MSPRAVALVELLHQELVRIGRSKMTVRFETDERTVTLEDPDGRWKGPFPIAYGVVATCGDGEVGSEQFWKRIAPLPS